MQQQTAAKTTNSNQRKAIYTKNYFECGPFEMKLNGSQTQCQCAQQINNRNNSKQKPD